MSATPEVAAVASPTAALLERLARPYDPARALSALTGMPARSARQVVGTIVATSAEAERLLEQMPHIVRSLAIATTDRPMRCYGELRGPVLWSETMSARSASAGDPGLYVCATTTKAYDTDENRVLTAALAAVARAGRDADLHIDEADVDSRRARSNGSRAARFLEHQALSAVPVGHVTGRSLRRTRAGSRRATYRPALDMLRRAGDPLEGEHIASGLDQRTIREHALLASVLLAVEAALGGLAPMRTARGTVVSGPVRYRHPALASGAEPSGVTVNGRQLAAVDEVDSALNRS